MDELKLLQNWNLMLAALEKAKKHWQLMEGQTSVVDATGVDAIVARAMTMAINTRSFELLLPDLVRYWRTHGGFDRLVVSDELVDQFKEEKKDD